MKLLKILSSVFSSNNYRERSKIQEGQEFLYDYRQKYSFTTLIIVLGILFTGILTPTAMREGGSYLIIGLQFGIVVLLFITFFPK